jgi:hypothetical protein
MDAILNFLVLPDLLAGVIMITKLAKSKEIDDREIAFLF